MVLRRGLRPPPLPPLTMEKIFFAFLDELGHSKHKLRSVTFDTLFFFYFEGFPKNSDGLVSQEEFIEIIKKDKSLLDVLQGKSY